MTTPDAPPPGSGAELAARTTAEVAALDRELAEIDMLVGQARTEAARHEQKRAQASEKLEAADRAANPREVADGYAQLVTLTRRAVLMEAQVEVLEGKRKALARHREALAALTGALSGVELPPPGAAGAGGGARPADGPAEGESLPPGLSRVVLSAQEDLRREIARSMHDGPAQSLTNIVLQAQIVERLMERDPERAKGELTLLGSMVQQTLDATKNFIFDVRPMVLDDLGLVPTLRRAARDRGRRAQVPVEYESAGQDRRLPMEVESAVFRILDESLAAYLALRPERVSLQLDWSDRLEARLSAHRTAVMPVQAEPLPEVPTDNKVPEALRQMIEDRHTAHAAAIEAAKEAAIVVLPASTRRDVADRAASIGATVEVLADGGELRLVVPLAEPAAEAAGEAT